MNSAVEESFIEVLSPKNFSIRRKVKHPLVMKVPGAGYFTPRHNLFLILTTGLAAALSFYSIADQSLWLDEAFSVALARLDWHEMWRVIAADQANMGLYYLLLHCWLQLGSGEFAVRSLSAIVAVVSIAPLYGLGARLFGASTGVIASLLLAVNVCFIRNAAQEARGYALVLLLATSSSYIFIKAISKPSGKIWAAYVVVGALSVYAHFFGGWVIAAHIVSAMILRRGLVRRRNLIVSHAFIALLVSPLLVPILTVSHLGWLKKSTLEILVRSFGALAGGPALAVVYFVVCFCALIVAAARRRRDHGRFIPWNYVFLLNWLLLPVLGSFIFSILFKPIFLYKYLIISLPPLVLIAAAGVQSLRPAWLRLATLLLILTLSGQGLRAWYIQEKSPKENWRAATKYVLDNSQAGDGVVFQAPYGRIPFEYYVQTTRSESKAPRPVFPSAPWGELDLLSPQISETFGEWLNRNRQDHPRLWLILREQAGSEHSDLLPKDFEKQYCSIGEHSFTGIQVMLYQSCP